MYAEWKRERFHISSEYCDSATNYAFLISQPAFLVKKRLGLRMNEPTDAREKNKSKILGKHSIDLLIEAQFNQLICCAN